MTLELLEAELAAIELWDADYHLQLLKHYENTHCFLARQVRRVEIIRLMQKCLAEAAQKSTDA